MTTTKKQGGKKVPHRSFDNTEFVKPKISHPRERVIPNLSLTGKDIKTRMNNRSLVVNKDGKQYSTDSNLIDLQRMSKADVFREMQKNAKAMNELGNKLQQQQAKPKQAEPTNKQDNV